MKHLAYKLNDDYFRYDSEYDDLRLASASGGGPILSDGESDLPPELDDILDNAVMGSEVAASLAEPKDNAEEDPVISALEEEDLKEIPDKNEQQPKVDDDDEGKKVEEPSK